LIFRPGVEEIAELVRQIARFGSSKNGAKKSTWERDLPEPIDRFDPTCLQGKGESDDPELNLFCPLMFGAEIAFAH
jgi:hypothetical protein